MQRLLLTLLLLLLLVPAAVEAQVAPAIGRGVILKSPTADGTVNQALVTDGSGSLSFATVTIGGLGNIVEDTTPQLGGNLDLNGNGITSPVLMQGTASSAGAIRLFEDTDNGTDYVEILSPATLGANDSWTWPAANAAGVFKDDGAGTVSIATILTTDATGALTGLDANFVTGTAGGTDEVLTFNADGDAVSSSGLVFDGDHLVMTLTSAPGDRGFRGVQSHDDTEAFAFQAQKDRDGAILQASDGILRIVAQGYDGSNYLKSGKMGFEIPPGESPEVAGGNMPTQWTLDLMDDATPSVLTQRLIMRHDGISTFTSDLEIYDTTVGGNPLFRIGSSSTEEFRIKPVYDVGGSGITLNYVELSTTAVSADADKGRMLFKVDGTNILWIEDSGIDFAAGFGISINNTAILTDDGAGLATLNNIDALDSTTESTIEAAIDTLANLTSASSLSTIGTVTTGVWNGTAIEGTAIASTGEAGGTKFLREDGDGTSSWQAVGGTITALNNQAENRLVSIGATTTELDGEANLTFTGTVLGLNGQVDLTEVSAPGTPAASLVSLYAVDQNGRGEVETITAAGTRRRMMRDSTFVGQIDDAGGFTAGEVVYISGASGANEQLQKYIADGTLSGVHAGISLEAGANNDFIHVLTLGKISGLNTSAYLDGDPLYASASVAGGLTATKPTHPNLQVEIGIVTRAHASAGEIFIRPIVAMGDGLGTRENNWSVGDNTAGAKTVTFRNANDGVLSWTPSAGRTLTLPDATDTLVGRDTTDTLTTKTIALGSNTITGTKAELDTTVSDGNPAYRSGSFSDGQILVGTAADTAESTANLTWDDANGFLTVYDGDVDAVPALLFGYDGDDRLQIQMSSNGGTAELDTVTFATLSTGVGANDGRYVFNADGTENTILDDNGQAFSGQYIFKTHSSAGANPGILLGTSGTERVFLDLSVGAGTNAEAFLIRTQTAQAGADAGYISLRPDDVEKLIVDDDGIKVVGTSSLKLPEIAAAPTDETGWAQIWAKTDNTLWWTDEAGMDTEISSGGGGGTVDTSGTPADSQIAVFTDADTIEGTANFQWVDATGAFEMLNSAAGSYIEHYNSGTDGDPEFRLGNSDSERFRILSEITSSNLTSVTISTQTGQTGADDGQIIISPDDVEKLRINDDGIEVTGELDADRVKVTSQEETATFTLDQTDVGFIECNSSSLITVTLPNGLDTDSEWTFVAEGTGDVTFTATSGDLRSRGTGYDTIDGRYGVVHAKHVGGNAWYLWGDLKP